MIICNNTHGIPIFTAALSSKRTSLHHLYLHIDRQEHQYRETATNIDPECLSIVLRIVFLAVQYDPTLHLPQADNEENKADQPVRDLPGDSRFLLAHVVVGVVVAVVAVVGRILWLLGLRIIRVGCIGVLAIRVFVRLGCLLGFIVIVVDVVFLIEFVAWAKNASQSLQHHNNHNDETHGFVRTREVILSGILVEQDRNHKGGEREQQH